MKEEILALVRKRLGLVLAVAKVAIPPEQYDAFRKISLDAFGQQGLEGDLDKYLSEGTGGKARRGMA